MGVFVLCLVSFEQFSRKTEDTMLKYSFFLLSGRYFLIHHNIKNVQYRTIYLNSFQVILPHFLNAITPHVEDQWCDDLEVAWKTLFVVILFHMKEGYNGTSNSQKLNNVEPLK